MTLTISVNEPSWTLNFEENKHCKTVADPDQFHFYSVSIDQSQNIYYHEYKARNEKLSPLTKITKIGMDAITDMAWLNYITVSYYRVF